MGCENPAHAGYGYHKPGESCTADFAVRQQEYVEAEQRKQKSHPAIPDSGPLAAIDGTAGEFHSGKMYQKNAEGKWVESGSMPDGMKFTPGWPDETEVRRMEEGHRVDEVMHSAACICAICENRRLREQHHAWQDDVEKWAARYAQGGSATVQSFEVDMDAELVPIYGPGVIGIDFGFPGDPSVLEIPFSQVVFVRARSVGKGTIARSLSDHAASSERRREALAKLPRADAVADGADAELFVQRFQGSQMQFRLADIPLEALQLLLGMDAWTHLVEQRDALDRWADDGGPCV